MDNTFLERHYVIMNAGDIAQQRLYDYLEKHLKGLSYISKWEFFNFLLKQAKKHEMTCSGFIHRKDERLEYRKDDDEARSLWNKKMNPEKKEEA